MKTVFSALVFSFLGTFTWAVSPLDEIIDKHIQAKGGAENWAKIKSMKITGTYTGFSIPADFTLYRSRPNKFYFDHQLNKRKMLIGYDGQQAWIFDGWKELPITTTLTGNDYKVMIQNAEFATPFFDHAQRGLKVTYQGEGEFDGSPTLILEVERGEDHKETWHLNPENYLEYARISPGSNFGNDILQTTFFDDFRQVNGVMIPFYTESEFHTRHRIMEISKIEMNHNVDETIFKWPVEPHMAPLQIMAGTWNVQVEERSRPNQPWQKSETSATIEKHVRGHLFIEKITFGPEGNQNEYIRQWSYDPFKKIYRVTQINDYTTHLNIFEGAMENGLLKVDNAETGTPWQAFGRTFHEGLQWHQDGHGFVVEMVRSRDGGKQWVVNKRFKYTKP